MKKFFIWPAMKNELFSLPKNIKKYNLSTCQKVKEALIYLLDNIYIRFGSKPQSHIHDFGSGRATIHPDLSNLDASA